MPRQSTVRFACCCETQPAHGAGRAAVTALDGGFFIAQLVMISCSGWVDPSEPAEEVSELRS